MDTRRTAAAGSADGRPDRSLAPFDRWLDALDARHRQTLRPSEFLKALRALSARYVEQRAALSRRSPVDSSAKRAAFAAFYAPVHFLTVREVVRAVGAAGAPQSTIVDLGCGTGAASAAWALECAAAPAIRGVERDRWARGEAGWTWHELGLHGRAQPGDLVQAVRRLAAAGPDRAAPLAAIAAWSLNELPDEARRAALTSLLSLAARGASVLVIEPLAKGAAPWWRDWAAAVERAGGRADQWKFDVQLPPRLAATDEAAGFRREGLGARSLYLDPRPGA